MCSLLQNVLHCGSSKLAWKLLHSQGSVRDISDGLHPCFIKETRVLAFAKCEKKKIFGPENIDLAKSCGEKNGGEVLQVSDCH